ncbi:plectin-like, partial [Lagopus leucura]|uniref:plectin-like n=1 Tax=Lagopus leucura TaxID=30410 RepID=UPI001C679B6F
MGPYGSQCVPMGRIAHLTLYPPLQRLRSQANGHAAAFAALQEELSRARAVNERMERGHSERDADLQRYGHRVEALLRRWDAALAQMELRLRDLQLLGRRMQSYRQSCDALQEWIRQARLRQESIQAAPIADCAAVREQLLQEKKLLEECEQQKEKVEECQRYAKQYIDAIKVRCSPAPRGSGWRCCGSLWVTVGPGAVGHYICTYGSVWVAVGHCGSL